MTQPTVSQTSTTTSTTTRPAQTTTTQTATSSSNTETAYETTTEYKTIRIETPNGVTYKQVPVKVSRPIQTETNNNSTTTTTQTTSTTQSSTHTSKPSTTDTITTTKTDKVYTEFDSEKGIVYVYYPDGKIYTYNIPNYRRNYYDYRSRR